MAQLDKKFGGAPFGTQTPRFDVAGVHPASKMPASYTQVSLSNITLLLQLHTSLKLKMNT